MSRRTLILALRQPVTVSMDIPQNLRTNLVYPNRPELMNLSLAETDEEAELRAVELHWNICQCFTYGVLIVLYVSHDRLPWSKCPSITRSLVRCDVNVHDHLLSLFSHLKHQQQHTQSIRINFCM